MGKKKIEGLGDQAVSKFFEQPEALPEVERTNASGNISGSDKGETRSSVVEMFPPQKQGMEIFPHPESKSC